MTSPPLADIADDIGGERRLQVAVQLGRPAIRMGMNPRRGLISPKVRHSSTPGCLVGREVENADALAARLVARIEHAGTLEIGYEPAVTREESVVLHALDAGSDKLHVHLLAARRGRREYILGGPERRPMSSLNVMLFGTGSNVVVTAGVALGVFS
jgi:hypothetical protein